MKTRNHQQLFIQSAHVIYGPIQREYVDAAKLRLGAPVTVFSEGALSDDAKASARSADEIFKNH